MKILVVGAKGQVGTEIVKILTNGFFEVVGISRRELDCKDLSRVRLILNALTPDVIINAAAYTLVEHAEDEPSIAELVNVHFVSELTNYCQKFSIPLIQLSTDYVFDGIKLGSYSEEDIPNPQTVYGRTKFAGEKVITNNLSKYIILRVSWVFGVHGTNFVKSILNLSLSREELKVVHDQWGKPTSATDIARVILLILEQIKVPSFEQWGVYHYAGNGVTNWYDFARIITDKAKEKTNIFKIARLLPIKSEEYIAKVNRPMNSVLNASKIECLLGIECQSWVNYLPEVIDGFINKVTQNEISN